MTVPVAPSEAYLGDNWGSGECRNWICYNPGSPLSLWGPLQALCQKTRRRDLCGVSGALFFPRSLGLGGTGRLTHSPSPLQAALSCFKYVLSLRRFVTRINRFCFPTSLHARTENHNERWNWQTANLVHEASLDFNSARIAS